MVEGRKDVVVGRHEVDEAHQRQLGVDVRTETSTVSVVLDEPRVVWSLPHNIITSAQSNSAWDRKLSQAFKGKII